jgi:hypothetical protein
MLRKPLPQFVAPMTASVVKEPFNHPDWIFETAGWLSSNRGHRLEWQSSDLVPEPVAA